MTYILLYRCRPKLALRGAAGILKETKPKNKLKIFLKTSGFRLTNFIF